MKIKTSTNKYFNVKITKKRQITLLLHIKIKTSTNKDFNVKIKTKTNHTYKGIKH